MSTYQAHTPQANILVVDDTPMNVRLLINILAEQGYTVRVASNDPHVKTDERTCALPVIFISAPDGVEAHDELEMRVEARTTELSRANRLLQQEIRERQYIQAELENAKEAAEAASRAKSEFLANMSHEFRTPLNAILGYAQILKTAENLRERQKEEIEIIRSSGEHLLYLISDLLNLAKIEAGRLELSANEFHLPQFLKYITDMIRIRAEQKGISFVYEPAPNLPVGVRTDEKRLREVLINLLGNAVKFTEKGEVRLSVDELHEFNKSNDVYNSTTQQLPPQKTLRFQVEDTGVGIAQENLKEIFLPFHQVGDHHYSVEGTGLGLAISYNLVKLMGSELHVKSTIGKGTVFWFDVNLSEVSGFVPKTPPCEQRIIGYDGRQRTILVVDDNKGNRAVLVGMLMPLGFNILEAENGQECVEKAISIKPDLIFLDLRMPVLDGFGAVKQLRQSDDMQDVVIIAISASVFDETRTRALAIGFNDFLIKPFQLKTLVELLHTHLCLEWVHEENTGRSAEIDAQADLELTKIVPFSPAEAKTLIKLARLGMAREILSALHNIEQQDGKYLPGVNHLRQFAKNYQFEQIIEFLEKWSGSK